MEDNFAESQKENKELIEQLNKEKDQAKKMEDNLKNIMKENNLIQGLQIHICTSEGTIKANIPNLIQLPYRHIYKYGYFSFALINYNGVYAVFKGFSNDNKEIVINKNCDDQISSSSKIQINLDSLMNNKLRDQSIKELDELIADSKKYKHSVTKHMSDTALEYKRKIKNQFNA